MKEEEIKILALDPATITGYCSNYGGGIWNFQKTSRVSVGLKFLMLKKALKSILEKEGIDLLVYEQPTGRFFTAIRSGANFEGVILEFCESNEIDYKSYTATEIKKFATGKGNAGKPMMMEAAKKYGVEILDDNHADAMHLFHLAKSELT